MNRGLPKFRGYQQTIPNMMRLREEQTQIFHSPLRTTSIMDNGRVIYQPQNPPSGSRINPYEVPFQRRQTIEPVYADTPPIIMPQAIQLSSGFGLGGIFPGSNEIFNPNVHQHNFESPAFSRPSGIKDDSDSYLTGLTSSPPNHFVHQVTKPNLKKPEANPIEKKDDIDTKTEKIITPENKVIVEPPNTSMRVLTGSVEKILKWEKMWETKKDKPPVLFEVVAPLLQIKKGNKSNEHQLLLRESEGPVLTVMYYEIDHAIPNLNRGQNVRCVCRSLGKKRFQAFSVRPASQQEHSSLQRLSFLCQRAAQEAFLDSPKI